jgi:hypothetical protein
MTTIDMLADHPGTWMFHCHVRDHMEAGMMAVYTAYGAPAARLPACFQSGRLLEASGKLYARRQKHQPQADCPPHAHIRDVFGTPGFAATLQLRVVIGQADFARSGANSRKAGDSCCQRPVGPGLGLLPVFGEI